MENKKHKKTHAIDTVQMAKGLYEQALSAKNYLSLIQQFHRNVEKYPDAINVSPGFYRISYDAWVNALLMDLAKLFDSTSASRTIKRLLSELNQATEHRDCLKEYETKMISLNSLLERIRKQRNKVYAHNDGNLNFQCEKVWSVNKLTLDDLSNLVEFALTVCVEAVFLLTGKAMSSEVAGDDDWEITLQILQESLESQGE